MIVARSLDKRPEVARFRVNSVGRFQRSLRRRKPGYLTQSSCAENHTLLTPRRVQNNGPTYVRSILLYGLLKPILQPFLSSWRHEKYGRRVSDNSQDVVVRHKLT